MFNKEEIKNKFLNYVETFDETDERISLKKLHSKNVACLCEDIAESLYLEQHDKDLIWTAGLLHDIGRFAQASTNTYIDSLENDHANLGADFLYNDCNLESFVGEISKDDRLMLWLAIINHNKLSSETLSEKQEMMCNIVRDADKLDFFRIFTVNSFEVVHESSREIIEQSTISDVVANAFFEHKTIDFATRKTPADIFISNIALPFGLVFPYSMKRALSDGYVQRIIDFEFKNEETQKIYSRMRMEMLEYLSIGNSTQ